jgi:hypothetical protein
MSPANPKLEAIAVGGREKVSLPFRRALTTGELPRSECLVEGFEVYAPLGTQLSSAQADLIRQEILDMVRKEAPRHSSVSGLRSWLSTDGSIRLSGARVPWKKSALRISPL